MNELVDKLEQLKNIEGLDELLEIIKSYPDEVNYEYEKMAFSFTTDGDYAYEVDSYFKPSFHFVTKYPTLESITLEALTYWKKRATETSNDILRARYGDLVWNFHKSLKIQVNEAFNCAKLSIQSYLTIVKNRLINDPFILNEMVIRAYYLAKSLNQKEDIEEVQVAMIDLEKSVPEDSHISLWGFSYDNLILEKSEINEEQKTEIIDAINSRFVALLQRANSGENNWHALEFAVSKLITYYFKEGDKDKIQPILIKLEDSVDQSKFNSHLKGYRYQQIYKLYESVQIHTEASRLLRKIENTAVEGLENLKMISVKTDLEQKELEEFISIFTTGDIEVDLPNIAVYFIPKIDQYELQIQKRESQGIGVLNRFFSHSPINQAGLAMATLDMTERENQLAQEITMGFQISSQYLFTIMNEFIKKHQLNENTFTEILSNKLIHDKKMETLLKVGLKHYLNNDYISAAHLLIPYVESTLRNVIRENGGNIYKPNKKGGYDAFLLGDILSSQILKEVLTPDIIFYFKLVYNDVRGYNLRNNLAHGLVEPSYFNAYTVQLIIHSLMILSCIRPLTNEQ
ncbi:hypothetical protein COE55_18490 [Priestia megaterium]|uniref:DUF4209 domain-containing protein n=1 Tax=Priestia megaterium TaxID=1404 RepID=UPI000BFD4312|nr:DUF4209 domain-containing protein [Priestia megaterium]PGZ76948.1 hypothetical protein COE55_18490 [Priestia megaterium]